jgi:uncharacterized membrane protein
MQELVIQLSLYGLILAMMIALAVLVVRRFRSYAVEDKGTSLDLLTNFREMSSKGDITDAEFRTIKSLLGDARGQTRASNVEQRKDAS